MSEDKSIITVPLVEEQKDQHTFIRLVSRSTEEEGYTGIHISSAFLDLTVL